MISRQKLERAAAQGLIFLVVAANLELFALNRLRADGYETAHGWGTLDALSTVRFRANVRHARYLGCTVSTNREGLRNPEVSAQLQPGERRILCLGDSETFGTGSEVQNTYPVLLQQILQERAPPGVHVNVINAGQPGCMAYRATGLLEELMPRYHPQVVTAMFGFNDSQSAYVRMPGDRNPAVVDRLRDLLYHSATYRYLRSLLQPRYEPSYDAAGQPVLSRRMTWWERSAANLLYLHEFLQARGVPMLLIAEAKRKHWTDPVMDPRLSAPGIYEKLKETYRDLGRRHHIPVLVMDDVFARSGVPEGQLFQENPVHTLPPGSRLIAQAMADALWKLGWVPKR